MRRNMKTPKRANLIGLQWRETKGVALVIYAATVWAQNALIGRFAVAMAHTLPTPPNAVKVPSRRSEGFSPLTPPLNHRKLVFACRSRAKCGDLRAFLDFGLDLRVCFAGVLGRAFFRL